MGWKKAGAQEPSKGRERKHSGKEAKKKPTEGESLELVGGEAGEARKREKKEGGREGEDTESP